MPAGRDDRAASATSARQDQVAALVDAVLDRHGRIDLLVNNAGGQFLAPAEAITPKGFRTVIPLNVEGTWLMTHAVATQAMIPAGGGKVVTITLSPHNGLPGMAHSAPRGRRSREPDAWPGDRMGALRDPLNAIAAGQFATDTLLTKYPQPIVERSPTRSRSAGWQARRVAWLVAPRLAGGRLRLRPVMTVDGARDNWLGRWPPAAATDDAGRPLAETRTEAGEHDRG